MRRDSRRSGRVILAGFTGSPKCATVTFSRPFPGDYSVVATVVTVGGRSYVVVVEDKTLAGFKLCFCTSSVSNLDHVSWTATLENA